MGKASGLGTLELWKGWIAAEMLGWLQQRLASRTHSFYEGEAKTGPLGAVGHSEATIALFAWEAEVARDHRRPKEGAAEDAKEQCQCGGPSRGRMWVWRSRLPKKGGGGSRNTFPNGT